MPPTDPAAAARRNGPPSTSDEIRNRMRACSAGRDTAAEMLVRRELHKRGVRYRVSTPIRVPGRRRAIRPDIVWSGRKIAVFIDGCFWHGCPWHSRPPKSNLEYWVPKLDRNRRRDLEQTAALERVGWTVLRFWEHQRPELVAGLIQHVLGQAG